MEEIMDSLRLPGEESELQARFETLQKKLIPLWESIEQLNRSRQTIVVVPSHTVDFPLRGSQQQAYEERFLFLLMLLRQPNARLVYVTSQRILPEIVDYYLDLMPGVIASHARERLFLLSPQDGSEEPLSAKILRRPRLLEKIRSLIEDPDRAHLVPFNTTRLERDLALQLDIPMYGADPKFFPLGTKSGCRQLFKETGIAHPMGFENLRSIEEIVEAAHEIAGHRPRVETIMIKQNEGVSGSGNALLPMGELEKVDFDSIRTLLLERLRPEDPSLSIEDFLSGFQRMGGIVEERIAADAVRSPSVQLRITPLGRVELLSTHDQLLGGAGGQSYLGCKFPADSAYAALISRESMKVAERLAQEGVLGRFALDFLVAREEETWSPYAIELNLRKGGTTHPYLTLQFLTDGVYDPEAAQFRVPTGKAKYFVATDHFESENYRLLQISDVFDLAVQHGIHFDQSRQTGVVFHMMSALSEHGMIGFTAVGDSRREADRLFAKTGEFFDASLGL